MSSLQADIMLHTPPAMSGTVLSPMFRRTRKPNYTHEETLVLLEQLEAHRHILFGKSTNHQRAQLWTFIADAVNDVPNSAGRTVEELKHRWKDMSRKARLFARGLTSENIKNEQSPFAPSIYFEAIMRIMGEDAPEGPDFGMLSSTDSQNSASRFAEDSHMYPIKSEVDVKPDINIINNFLNSDYKPHNLNSQFVSKSSSMPSHNHENTPNNGSQHPAATAANYMGQAIHFPGSFQHRFSSHNVPVTDNVSAPSSSRHNGCASTHVSSYTPWNTQLPPTPARPMRFDPVTQEVTEIDEYDPDSDSTGGESCSSKLVILAGDKQSENAGNSTGQRKFIENTENTTSAELPGQPPRKKLRVNSTDCSMQALTMEELQKLYLIKKIEMVNQKTLCFKLLENKLKHEINLQQQTKLESSTDSNPQKGPIKLHRRTIIYEGSTIDCDEENDVNVDGFVVSRPRNGDADNCEQSRTSSDVSQDTEVAVNDDKINENQELSV